MSYDTLSNPQKWIIKGIPIIFIVGAFTHFLYDLTGNSGFIGLFAPVNESVWEHCKMALWPTILYWSIYYFFKGKKYNISIDKWFFGGLVSLIAALISIPMLFYFYTQAFGVELLWVDILILLVAVTIGQLLGLHCYNYAKGVDYRLSLLIYALLITMFFVFTFIPPHIPLFMDNSTGTYGIAG